MEQALVALAGVVVGGLISLVVAWANARWTAQREERAVLRKQQDSLIAELETLYGQILYLLVEGSINSDMTFLRDITAQFGTPIERLGLRAPKEIYDQYQETGKALPSLVGGGDEARNAFDKHYWRLNTMMKEHLESLRKEKALH